MLSPSFCGRSKAEAQEETQTYPLLLGADTYGSNDASYLLKMS
jgi:hypothetical protein